jgi:LemA protein
MKKQGLGPFAIALIVIAAIVILGGFWWMGTYNWAQVETQYQRRFDLITNLVKTVKSETTFEAQFIANITALTTRWQTGTIDQKIQAASQLDSALNSLPAITVSVNPGMTNFPNIASAAGYQDLMDELSNTENKVAVERGRFNEVVRVYNTKIKTFPTSIVAGASGFTAKQYFQASAGTENAQGLTNGLP